MDHNEFADRVVLLTNSLTFIAVAFAGLAAALAGLFASLVKLWVQVKNNTANSDAMLSGEFRRGEIAAKNSKMLVPSDIDPTKWMVREDVKMYYDRLLPLLKEHRRDNPDEGQADFVKWLESNHGEFLTQWVCWPLKLHDKQCWAIAWHLVATVKPPARKSDPPSDPIKRSTAKT